MVNCRTTVDLNGVVVVDSRRRKCERVATGGGGVWRRDVRRRGNRGGGMVLLVVGALLTRMKRREFGNFRLFLLRTSTSPLHDNHHQSLLPGTIVTVTVDKRRTSISHDDYPENPPLPLPPINLLPPSFNHPHHFPSTRSPNNDDNSQTPPIPPTLLNLSHTLSNLLPSPPRLP